MSSTSTTVSQNADPRTALLSIDQAADYLNITKATLYTWRSRRAGYGPPAVKVGGCVRFRQSDLDDWISAHTESYEEDLAEHDSSRGKAPHPAAGVPLTRRSARRGA